MAAAQQGKGKQGNARGGYRAPAKKTNWFAIGISIAAVVVVAAVAVVVVVLNNVKAAPIPAPEVAANIDQNSGAIIFGTGTNTVDTYIDFMCPYCNQFEQAEGEEISKAVDAGEITLNVHPVTILDRLSQGTQYSSRAAAAMYAVATEDPDNAYAFMQALYANQPAENSQGLSDDQLVQIAKDAGVNVTSDLEDAITSGEYVKFAQQWELPDGQNGTPTLLVNGEVVQVTYNYENDIASRLK